MSRATRVIEILKKNSNKFKDTSMANASLFKDPFRVLISCIISLRTKDEVTREASKRLFAMAKNVHEMSKLDVKEIEKLIYPAGFYKTKAKRIKEICKVLIEKYNCKVPCNVDELMKFKGVGRKTACVTMVYGFRRVECIPIDIHCHRIPNRLGWINTKNPIETEKELMKIIPKKYWLDFNDLFVSFGQNICMPVSPYCSRCPVRDYCKRIGVKRSR